MRHPRSSSPSSLSPTTPFLSKQLFFSPPYSLFSTIIFYLFPFFYRLLTRSVTCQNSGISLRSLICNTHSFNSLIKFAGSKVLAAVLLSLTGLSVRTRKHYFFDFPRLEVSHSPLFIWNAAKQKQAKLKSRKNFNWLIEITIRFRRKWKHALRNKVKFIFILQRVQCWNEFVISSLFQYCKSFWRLLITMWCKQYALHTTLKRLLFSPPLWKKSIVQISRTY